MKNLFVKPSRDAAGDPVLVRDPLNAKPLDRDGEWKEATPFWLRRVRDGDVIDATKEKLAAKAAPAKPAEKHAPAKPAGK